MSIMSMSSTDSNSSHSSYTSYTPSSRRSSKVYDLRARAIETLEIIRNPNNHESTASYVAPNATFTPGDCSSPMPLAAFLEHWQAKQARHPGLHMEIVEAMEDEDQRKVLIMSTIDGLPDIKRARAVDMLTFDEEGYITGGSLGWMHFRKQSNSE